MYTITILNVFVCLKYPVEDFSVGFGRMPN